MLVRTFRLSIMLAIVALLAIIFILKQNDNPRYASYINEINLMAINPKLASILATKGMDNNAVILHIVDNTSSIYRTANIINTYRIDTLWEFIKKIQKTHILPDGDYYISFNDAFRDDIGYPVLAYATTSKLAANKKVIPIPDIDAMHSYTALFTDLDTAIKRYPWNKKIPTIFWRGAATGKDPCEVDDTNFHRKTLVDFAANKHFLDVAFSSYAHILEMIPDFAERYALAERVTPSDSLAYRYLISIDGNSCSYSRMAWILYSNSILFKHNSEEVQWYYDKLQPWIHYIPVASDFSDLEQNYLWAEQHPLAAQEIAENGHILAKQIFTDEQIIQEFILAIQKSKHIIEQLSFADNYY